MTNTITLTALEIQEAIRLYLAGQGWRSAGHITINIAPGDRPGEVPTLTASVNVERAAAQQEPAR